MPHTIYYTSADSWETLDVSEGGVDTHDSNVAGGEYDDEPAFKKGGCLGPGRLGFCRLSSDLPPLLPFRVVIHPPSDDQAVLSK